MKPGKHQTNELLTAEDWLQKLTDKYAATGQDMISYLEGLYYTDYLSYWDYIHLDTLLTLQTPRTSLPDENIFIMYHQVTELYFKMILMEVNQIVEANPLTVEEFTMRISRVNRYVNILVESFAVMYDGMEQEQFLKFRMSLLPASGFQSVQFRTIEIASTDFNNLLNPEGKAIESTDWAERFKHIYWLQGATELSSGRKTYTLVQFEKKYAQLLIQQAQQYQLANLNKRVVEFVEAGTASTELISQLKNYDVLINITWRLMHFRSAVQYLHKEPAAIAATGGTNWQAYLPPKFQKRCFFPSLWTESEMQEWGKDWVKETLAKIKREA